MNDIDRYREALSPGIQSRFDDLRRCIRETVPGCGEKIAYAMPTWTLNGKNLLHAAAYDKHIGLYPLPGAIEAFRENLAPYKQGKGSVQFPHDRPLPLELIARIARYRAGEIGG